MSITDVPPEVRDAFAKYQFYHQIEVVPGVVTPGWQAIVSLTDAIRKELARQNFKGKRVLDIGCRDGLFSFDAERMGASSVVGIDNDLSTAATEFLIPFLKSKVQMRALNLYDLNSEKDGLFDFVIFCGVLYHLRYPFLGIDRIASIMTPGATLLLETAIWMTPNQLPLLYCPRPEDSPYEPTSVTFYNNAGVIDTLRAAGFEDIECRQILHDDIETPNKIGRGIYTCRKSITDERLAVLKKYWVGTHSLNSSVNEALSFLTDWDKHEGGSSVSGSSVIKDR